jgi:hypothetical protein
MSSTSSMTIELAVQRIETLEKQMDYVFDVIIGVERENSIYDEEHEMSWKEVLLYGITDREQLFNNFQMPIRPKNDKSETYDSIDSGPLCIIKNLMIKEIADANKLIRTENTNLPKTQHKSRLKLNYDLIFAHLTTASKAIDHNAFCGRAYHYETMWKATMKTTMEKEISDTNKLIDAENANLPEDQMKPLINKLNITDILPHIRSTLETDWNALDDTAQAIWNINGDSNIGILKGGKKRRGVVRSNSPDEEDEFDSIDEKNCYYYNMNPKCISEQAK